MVVFPNCKINLGLQVLGKRADGFHDLETFFYPILITDALEIVASGEDETSCITSGESIQVKSDDNICVKAYRLLKADFPTIPSVKIHLHKVIPIGAGLGGGSSDGANTLMVLNKKWSLGLDTNDLLRYASMLGSDCPFFIYNTPCYATGRGEMLNPTSLDLTRYAIVLVYPSIHINTSWAFAQLKLLPKRHSIREVIQQPVRTWKDELKNDFEESVFIAHPHIETIKSTLYQAGALYASLSGSGSTVFGLFEKPFTPSYSFPPHYFIRVLN